jgi:hypothetical protein
MIAAVVAYFMTTATVKYVRGKIYDTKVYQKYLRSKLKNIVDCIEVIVLLLVTIAGMCWILFLIGDTFI